MEYFITALIIILVALKIKYPKIYDFISFKLTSSLNDKLESLRFGPVSRAIDRYVTATAIKVWGIGYLVIPLSIFLGLDEDIGINALMIWSLPFAIPMFIMFGPVVWIFTITALLDIALSLLKLINAKRD